MVPEVPHTHTDVHTHWCLCFLLSCPSAQPCPHGLHEGTHHAQKLPKLERDAGTEGFMVVPNPHAVWLWPRLSQALSWDHWGGLQGGKGSFVSGLSSSH